MPLSRSFFTSKYGNLSRMMEESEQHKGYGDVTWKVGPHAGHKPYGDDHVVRFVHHSDLIGNVHPPESSHEVSQHANEIHQQMDRGDVINVPHIKREGGRFVMHPAHHGAVQAALKRGASKVPILVHNKDAGDLAFWSGGAEKPGDHEGLDPNFKWRWNGKGYYTKPSFNNGNCPPGSNASPGDRCVGGAAGGEVGGGPEPGSMRGQAGGPKPPAEDDPFGPDKPLSSQMPPGSPVDHMRAMRARAKKARAVGGPVGGGGGSVVSRRRELPPLDQDSGEDHGPISRSDVDQHSGVQIGKGLAPIAFAGAAGGGQARIKKAVEALAELAPDIKVDTSRYFGSGVSGVVHPATPKNGVDMVVKFDKGENEATLAKLTHQYPDIGALESLPKFDQVIDTGVRIDTGNGRSEKIYALYREDLHNPPPRMNNFFARFGRGELNPLSRGARGRTRHQHLMELRRRVHEGNWRQQAYDVDDHTGRNFDMLIKDIEHMIKRGISTCDHHGNNWGVRPSDKRIVMRDVGCSNFTSDVQ